ncbi:MAG TPA: SDR family oxidoreductase [Thermoanaerobaculia bacterium]
MKRATFADNVVIVTGASAGIGRELAVQLATQGARLALAARDGARLAEVAAECRQLGGQALAVPTDVADSVQCGALVAATVAAYGRVDTLINNAGISMWARFVDLHDLELFDRLLRVNYLGSVYCTHFALPHLLASRGRLVAVSSMTGRTGVPMRSGYAASKHAMTGFFDTLRIELAGTGVSVTVAYPDFVATEIRQRAFAVDGRPLGESPVRESEIMTAEVCARQIVAAAGARKREIVQSARGRVGLWLKVVAPGLVDRIARRAVERGK